MTDNIYISAESLMKRYQRRVLFRDISLRCSGGDSLAITGPNGSGKSTLLHVLAMLKDSNQGQRLLHEKLGAYCQGIYPLIIWVSAAL
jgi:ABC-type multidrug transport system ATPase subunit